MASHAKGTFQVTNWEENAYDEIGDGAKLTRARITQDFKGDFEGTGSWESLMCYSRDGTAVYLGLARLTGRLGGREGGIVLRTEGVFDGNEARTTWSVVPGAGTDGLQGLSGEGTSVAPHGPNGTYTLDYELD